MGDKKADIVLYEFTLNDISVIEKALVLKYEGDKIYTKDLNGSSRFIFNAKTGYCYNDNTTFGAKRVLLLPK